jgi:hypothetical protein
MEIGFAIVCLVVGILLVIIRRLIQWGDHWRTRAQHAEDEIRFLTGYSSNP